MTTGAANGTPHSVLLVDDTPDVRLLVRRALERSGGLQVVAEAGDGSAGVEAAREHQPDVVLLDIAMPVMDGLEALPLIRDAVPDATVIMLSGFGAEQMVDRALRSGADGYIQKGAPLSDLVRRVYQLMEDGSGPRMGGAGRGPVTLLPRAYASWRRLDGDGFWRIVSGMVGFRPTTAA